MSYIEIDPEIIYFTHSRIREKFSGCNKTLYETLEEIKSNKISVHDLPKITVYYDKINNTYFSQNNRRLWIFKYCKQNGLLDNKRSNQKSLDFGKIIVRIQLLPTNKKYSKETCSLNAKICLK